MSEEHKDLIAKFKQAAVEANGGQALTPEEEAIADDFLGAVLAKIAHKREIKDPSLTPEEEAAIDILLHNPEVSAEHIAFEIGLQRALDNTEYDPYGPPEHHADYRAKRFAQHEADLALIKQIRAQKPHPPKA